MKHRCLALLAAAIMLLFAGSLAVAEPEIAARVGYEGAIIEGQWIPIEAEILAEDSSIHGVLRVDVFKSSDMYDRMEIPVSVAAGERETLRFSVIPQIVQRSFELVLCDETGAVLAQTSVSAVRSIPEEALVIGAIGVDPALTDAIETVEVRDVYGRVQDIAVIELGADCYMHTEREIAAMDVLIASDKALSSLEDEQRRITDEWDANGGVWIADLELPEENEEGVSVDLNGWAEQLIGQITSELIDAERGNGYRQYAFGSGLTQMMRVGSGRSIAPACVLLMVYLIVVGAGLYRVFGKRDRQVMIWLAAPVLAVLCTICIVLLGAVIRISDPAAAQLLVLTEDEQGNLYSEESAVISYAGQGRERITTQENAQLERKEYTYFDSYSDASASMTLRDRITLGKRPGIELTSGAVWLERNLAVDRQIDIEGMVNAQAWMEEDGLHVRIVNDLETRLENAWLLTEIGYAHIGEIRPDETVDVLLLRSHEFRKDKKGNVLIPPGTAIPYSVSLYQVVQALIDPEKLTDETFNHSKLSDEEEYARNLLSSKLELSNQVRQDVFACVLVADVPEINCVQLEINEKRIGNTAKESVLIKQIPFDPVSTQGYVYYPQGEIAAHAAQTDENGCPQILEKTAEGYFDSERIPECFGFDVGEMNLAEVYEIRVMAQYNRTDEEYEFEAYDWTAGEWIKLEGRMTPRLAGEMLKRVLADSGELFLRPAGLPENTYGIYTPEMIAEGRAQ